MTNFEKLITNESGIFVKFFRVGSKENTSVLIRNEIIYTRGINSQGIFMFSQSKFHQYAYDYYHFIKKFKLKFKRYVL